MSTIRNGSKYAAVGSSQRPWNPYPKRRASITYTGALPAVTVWLHFLAPPKTASDLSAAGTLWIPVDPGNTMLIKPWILGAAGKIANFRFWGVTDSNRDRADDFEYFGDVICDLAATGGNGVALASGSKVLPDNARFCDTLAITNDVSLGTVRKVHNVADGAGCILFDMEGLAGLIAEGTCTAAGTAPTGCGVLIRTL